MRFFVPTNWQKDFIDAVKLPGVDVIYGKLEKDFFGGGRPSYVLPYVSKKMAQKEIDLYHKNGFKFYYLVNSLCLGNLEWTKSGYRQIRLLFDWLAKIKVDGVVVALPHVAEIVKKFYPHFSIGVSCFANVNSIEKAKYWEDLGVDGITLSQDLNREFKMIRRIRSNVKCDLQLIANNNCAYECPYFTYHASSTAHASQKGRIAEVPVFDYCRLTCRRNMLLDPANFIRAGWIRPEDAAIYEQNGINSIKLVGRDMITKAIANIVNAYTTGHYGANLYSLFPAPSSSLLVKQYGIFRKLKYFMQPFKVNLLKLRKKIGIIKDLRIYIDNTELNGFINHFIENSCQDISCADCGYCSKVASRVVKIDKEYLKGCVEQHSCFRDEIISGYFFDY